MKRYTWILIAVVALALVVAPGLAFANNGPHGGYVADTDMCAACHRAHTAPSSVTWTDNQGAQKNALLVADSSMEYQFCLACHDASAQGADTNVVDGKWEGALESTRAMLSGAFGRTTGGGGTLTDLNGATVSSTHLMNGQSWGAYGGGVFGSTSVAAATGNDPALNGTGAKIVMSCGTCHDPHGSSNYRILKDTVYGVAVGGYDQTAVGNDPFGNPYSATNPKPTPYVTSIEDGYPAGGFQLHVKYPSYKPSYTVAHYAQGSTAAKGMTGWCIGCHTVYADASGLNAYNAADGLGFVTRHRHPMNVSLDKYTGFTPLVLNSGLPLAHAASETSATQVNTLTDWMDCMACHNAHGSTAKMTGYADPTKTFELADGSVVRYPAPDSALLKMDNRGVCEACHNK